jgi:hypothetical protein
MCSLRARSTLQIISSLLMLLLLACSLCEPVDAASLSDDEYASFDTDKTLDWSKTKADYDKLKYSTRQLQYSNIAIDGQAPNFSGDAVINGDITTCAL